MINHNCREVQLLLLASVIHSFRIFTHVNWIICMHTFYLAFFLYFGEFRCITLDTKTPTFRHNSNLHTEPIFSGQIMIIFNLYKNYRLYRCIAVFCGTSFHQHRAYRSDKNSRVIINTTTKIFPVVKNSCLFPSSNTPKLLNTGSRQKAITITSIIF